MSAGLRANEPLVVFAGHPLEKTCKKCDISQLSIPLVIIWCLPYLIGNTRGVSVGL